MIDPLSESVPTPALTLRLDKTTLQQVRFSPYLKEKPAFALCNLSQDVSPATAVRQALEPSPLMKEPAAEADVLFSSPYTLLPLPFFREAEVERVYYYNFPHAQGVKVHYDVLPTLGAALLYGADELTEELLGEMFPTLRLHAASTAALERFSLKSKSYACCRLYGLVRDMELELMAFRDGRLLLANRYAIRCVEDAFYFVTLAFQTLKMDTNKDEIFLLAHDEERCSALRERLREFYSNVYKLNPSGLFNRHPLTKIEGLAPDLLLFLLRQY